MGTSRSQALLPGFLFCFWLTQRSHTSSKCPFSRGRVRQVRCHTGSFALSELDTMKIRSLQCLVSSKTPTPMQIPPCHHVLWMLRALGWLPQLSALDSPLKLTASLDEFSLQAMGKYKQKRGRLSGTWGVPASPTFPRSDPRAALCGDFPFPVRMCITSA